MSTSAPPRPPSPPRTTPDGKPLEREEIEALVEALIEEAAGGRQDAIVAWCYLFACWATRAFGSAALLSALGMGFTPEAALAVICLGAAAGVVPITSGGAAVNAGAAAAILLALGVGKNIAINFSLASGLLLVTSALAASLCGVMASVAMRMLARAELARPL